MVRTEEKVPVWGDCPDDVTEELEFITDLTIEKSFFAEHSGSVIMFQLDDGTRMSNDLLRLLLHTEICYKNFLYILQEVKAVCVADGNSVVGGSRLLIIFQQQTRMM